MEKKVLENLLRDRNLRVTPKRMEPLMLIASYGSAIPYSVLQKELKSYDRVTLYRTLNALLDGGIIHKASVTSNEVYYAMCKEYCTSECHNHKHVHFKCSECLEVSCIEISNTINLEIPNVIIKDIAVEVSGICGNCH